MSHGETVFGDVVDDRADAPDATVGGFEFGEVGLPDSVAFGGRVAKHFAPQHRPGFAVGPKALREKQSAPPKRSGNRGVGDLVAVGAHQRGDLAVPPGRPGFTVFGGQCFDAIHPRRRPGPLRRVAVA